MFTIAELGQALTIMGKETEARTNLEEALSRAIQLKYPSGEAWARCSLGTYHYLFGDLPAARTQLSEAIALYRQIDDRSNGPWANSTLARVALAEGNRAETRTLLGEAIGMVVQRRGQLHNFCRSLAILSAACDDGWLCARLLGCRAGLDEREIMLPWDEADVRWAEATAREQLGDEGFAVAFREAADVDPYELIPDGCARLDPQGGHRLPPRWDGFSPE
jgi:tetratricopeptide (TPR) repeat protein